MDAPATLLMRFAGPMQSWGLQSRFVVRDTAREPTKSGVIGLLCAALGRPRDEPVDDLAKLRLGIRVDQEGTVAREYQTVGGGTWPGRPTYGVAKVDGKDPDTEVTFRYYLADVVFLVGLEGDPSLLQTVAEALRKPHWPLYLGRKSYVAAEPVLLEDRPLRPGPLEATLRSIPWPVSDTVCTTVEGRRPEFLRVVLEEPDLARAERVQLDQPVGAAFRDRRFGLRGTRTEFWQLGVEIPIRDEVKRCI